MTNLETKLIVVIVFVVAVVSAGTSNDTEEVNATIEKTNDSAALTDIGTSRIKHHYLPLYGGTALLGLGGLHALAVLYAIKIKVIVVGIIIALSIYYYSKIYLKGCHYKEIIRDTNPYESGYSNSLPAGIGYPGTDRFNSLSIASIDHDHHHEHMSPSHESIPSSVESDIKSSSPASTPITAEPEVARRIYNQMRQFTSPLFNNIDWSDMAFQLLGLDSDDCRRRFTCELDFRVKQIPFSSYMFEADGPAFLDKYRETENDVNKATTFSDCALFYGECKY
ncbi:uncharacterized protein LOC119084964 isoform X2 [Bradysia coprophila]|uniref:uncharacterized protein LOC119084964 isoform X2 n=1 Tax=Bradysia coprophila TaxID=38358 RepID=UPI00187DC379|nr:uncharacterized protein LOC119084964 isoform X2 [Bradysia coprophila]